MVTIIMLSYNVCAVCPHNHKYLCIEKNNRKDIFPIFYNAYIISLKIIKPIDVIF